MAGLDFKQLTELLIKKGKVRGKPVAISLFHDKVPAGYEPIDDTPCSIVRFAMDDGRRVYFDAGHQDCLVGVHHAGIVPGTPEVVAGTYLSATSEFFTTEGAARLKSSDATLPPGMVKAIGAAPLDDVPAGVPVNWIVVVCNPHNANAIAACRMCSEGVRADAVFGTSLCVELFATPWQSRNCLVTSGDFGGRMHNRIKQDQLFVIIPIEYAHYLPLMLDHSGVDVKISRRMTKPAHSPFWKKADAGDAAPVPEQAQEDTAAKELYTMPWDDESRRLMAKVPEGILEMVVGNAEDFARGKNYDTVTRKSLDEQMATLGMNLDEMLDAV